MEVYLDFINEPKERFQEIVSKHGKDVVYENIGLAGGVKRPRRGKYSRMVAIPIDSEDMRESTVFAVFSTNPNGDKYNYPFTYRSSKKGSVSSLSSFHPSDFPAELREPYRETLLKKLERLEKGLSKTD